MASYTLHLGDFFHNNDLSYVEKGKLIAERIKMLVRRNPRLSLNYDLLDYADGLANLTGWASEDEQMAIHEEFNMIMDEFRIYANREGIAIVTQ